MEKFLKVIIGKSPIKLLEAKFVRLFYFIRRNSYLTLIGLLNIYLKIVPINYFRLIVLKIAGAHIGNNVTVQRGVRVDFPWRLHIGDNCCIGRGVYLDCRGGGIKISANSDISEDAIIFTLSHHIQSADFCTKKGDVIIGMRCWICARAIVLPGGVLSLGSVLSSNSVYSGQSDEFDLLVGNPAVRVKSLSRMRASDVRKFK